MYNILKKEIITNRNLNIRALTDEFLKEFQKCFSAPYKLIGFSGEVIESILNPFIKTIRSKDLLKSLKAASESITKEDIERWEDFAYTKEILLQFSTGIYNPHGNRENIPNESSPNRFAMWKFIGEKGGYRKYLDFYFKDDEYLQEFVGPMENKDSDAVSISKEIRDDQFSINYLYYAYKYASDPKQTFNEGIPKIPLSLSIKEFIETISDKYDGEKFISNINLIIDKACRILRMSEDIVGKTIYRGLSLVFDIIEIANKEFSTKDASIGSFLDGVFTHGKEVVEYMNKLSQAPSIDSVNSNFFKLYESSVAIKNAIKVDVNFTDPDSISLEDFRGAYFSYFDRASNASAAVFGNVKGEIFNKLKAFDEIHRKMHRIKLQIMRNHNKQDFEYFCKYWRRYLY